MSEQNEVPWHLRTWTTLVWDETVEVPVTTTIREIKERLPEELLAEFTTLVENTPGDFIKTVIAQWGVPVDMLLERKRRVAAIEARLDAGDDSDVIVFRGEEER